METITYESEPFASGSYKKVYNIKPTTASSTIIFDNIHPEKDKIITRISVYYFQQSIEHKKQALSNALSELEMQMMFYSVNLAPNIYAIYFVIIKMVNGKHEHTHHVYYIDAELTVNKVYTYIQEHLSFDKNEHLYLLTLSDACYKKDFYNAMKFSRLIVDFKHMFELVDTYIQKLVYNKYLFLDFKPSNMCILVPPGGNTHRDTFLSTKIIGLDFDRKFIIHFSKIPLSEDVVAKISRTYMFSLAASIILRNYQSSSVFIKILISQHHISRIDIIEMVDAFVELEKTGHHLCANKYNPLSMLAFYLLTSQYFNDSDVYKCIDLNKPVNTWPISNQLRLKHSNVLTSNLVGYEFIKNMLINELIDTSSGDNNNIKSLYISAEFIKYKSEFLPLSIQPTIPYFNENIVQPMFSLSDILEPSNKKLRTKGGRRKHKKTKTKNKNKKHL